jgi:hypothetical protein
VIDVDRPDRSARRRNGKSDPLDAESAARAVQSGRASGTPKSRDATVEMIRTLRGTKQRGSGDSPAVGVDGSRGVSQRSRVYSIAA